MINIESEGGVTYVEIAMRQLMVPAGSLILMMTMG